VSARRYPRPPARVWLVGLALAAVTLAGGCEGPILALPPIERAAPPEAPPPSPVADPVAIRFPRDDGPHDRLTEWWYYTGHLSDESGGSYGFEYVIFRAERGDFPVSWAAHLAITDEDGDRFLYGQRTEVGAAVDRSPRDASGEPVGFAFVLTGDDPASGPPGGPAWWMARRDGVDTLDAIVTGSQATTASSAGAMGIQLRAATARDPVLHDRDGWIDFGPAGGSYYYSRTRLRASGTLTIDGTPRPVTGTAWFDHQWGNFIAVGGGGWDWYAVGLDDGTDVTISQVRDASGAYPLIYGTLVDPDGTVRHLPRESLVVTITDRWTSPHTGADYPAGWRIDIPTEALTIGLRPTVADQELDTRASTGVIYWEGSQVVRATRQGRALSGQAYVELTGYADEG
jgi:predicted secreted hydrolase